MAWQAVDQLLPARNGLLPEPAETEMDDEQFDGDGYAANIDPDRQHPKAAFFWFLSGFFQQERMGYSRNRSESDHNRRTGGGSGSGSTRR